MSKRDIVKTASLAGTLEHDTVIPEAYKMSLSDLQTLYTLYMADGDRKKLWYMIDLVFRYGFVQGNRATINRGMKIL